MNAVAMNVNFALGACVSISTGSTEIVQKIYNRSGHSNRHNAELFDTFSFNGYLIIIGVVCGKRKPQHKIHDAYGTRRSSYILDWGSDGNSK